MPEQVATASADERFESLVKKRFDDLVERFPVYGSYLGLHQYDSRLGDSTRDAQLQDMENTRRFISELEQLDSGELSEANRFERDLALFASRRQQFDDEVQRLWERRVSGTDDVGDGLFLLFARTTRPFAERFDAMASRLEQAPRVLQEQRTRLGEHPQRLWNELELDAAGSLPGLFGEVIGATRTEFGDDSAEVKRVEQAAAAAQSALQDYSAWLREQLGRADDDFALGSDKYDQLVGLRAFDGLTTDDILAIGEEQLEFNKRRRREVAAEIDANASEADVLDRIKSDQPHDFEAALDGYRKAMGEARAFVADHAIATIPASEKLSIIPTPEYLRRVMPFAAYFPAAKFEPVRAGVYIVTPSIDGEARAMREHNWGSIYNTSIHEAYPGHHQQMTAALDNPSLVRLLVDAPEFVEGWAMYCEQMMREQGFDTAPERLVIMYTDAIWRACRIILDVRLHRGEISVNDAIDFMVEHTGFERANATAEVQRYTHTPTYQLSYLLGKVLLLRLREDEQRRLGDKFSLLNFHDALLAGGNLPISFHRRALAAAANGNGAHPGNGFKSA
jgi:uncharacterized protein (DUF885 family)